MPTRHFTHNELAALGVPPDDPDDIEFDEHVLSDQQVSILKYTALRSCVFRAPDDGKTYAVGYEAPIDVGDYEVGAGMPDNNGWRTATVEGLEVEEREVTVTQWVPVDDEFPVGEYRMSTRPQTEQHYEECPASEAEGQPCHCEGIDQAEENYRQEPPGFLG
jgi:hypothetical protein